MIAMPVRNDEYICQFCNKAFTQEKFLARHLCRKKMRWIDRDNRDVQIGHQAFIRFYEVSGLNYNRKRDHTFEDFMNSQLYTDFVRFGRFVRAQQVLQPTRYVEYLTRHKVPMRDWTNLEIYDAYLVDMLKHEPVQKAVERSVKLMQEWATTTGQHWTQFFPCVAPPQAALWIKMGRLSPWVLLSAPSAKCLFERFSEEQWEIVQRYANPTLWQKKFLVHKDDRRFVLDICEKAGI